MKARNLPAPAGETSMLREVMMFMAVAGAAYAWLCAIVAPVVTALRSCLRERLSRRSVFGLAIAVVAAVLWTVLPSAVGVLGMMLEPRAGLVLVQTRGLGAAFAAGIAAWVLHLALEQRMPRLGPTFEAATAIAIAAAVDDDDRSLARVEQLYRSMAIAADRVDGFHAANRQRSYRAPLIDGSKNVKTAPPPDAFVAVTSPSWRWTMARTIERPSPLPEGTPVSERAASTL
jgi:hypothetical protein